MIYIGKHITQSGDSLQPTEVGKIYKALINPKGEVAALLNNLRHIRMIDPNKYRKLKTGLPYLVCAKFHPMVRRKENFLSTERFMIDIDHLTEYNINIDQLKEKLREDKRVELFFSSPSGDGLKVLFRLSQKITESNYYALFYKAFCAAFGQYFKLGAALDIVTHDVTRCCFVSFDPEAYYNPEAERIHPGDYLSQENLMDFDRVQKEVRKVEKEIKAEALEVRGTMAKEKDLLGEDILNEIKRKIGQKIRVKEKKEYIQPEELKPLIEEIDLILSEVEIRLLATKPINYGRVIKVGAGNHWAELNIFYGQRGPTVVKTLKTGGNKELLEMSYMLISDYFMKR